MYMVTCRFYLNLVFKDHRLNSRNDVDLHLMDETVCYGCCHQKFDSSGVNILQKFEFYSQVPQKRVQVFLLTFFKKVL